MVDITFNNIYYIFPNKKANTSTHCSRFCYAAGVTI